MNNPDDKPDAKNRTPPVSDQGEPAAEERLQALRSMLAATEARHNKVDRVRHRTLAAGVPVRIRGDLKQKRQGVILDADYIHSRVLVELVDENTEVWFNFTDVVPLTD